MQADIRRLDACHAAELFALRRVALATAPGAFASAPETDRISDVEAACRILSDTGVHAVFGAFDPQLIGMVGLRREPHARLAHRAYLWGMFVHPSAQSAGVGRRLMHAVIEHARTVEGLAWLDLSVTEDAPAALALYRSLGFAVWGKQSDALRECGRSLSELHCALRLDAPE